MTILLIVGAVIAGLILGAVAVGYLFASATRSAVGRGLGW